MGLKLDLLEDYKCFQKISKKKCMKSWKKQRKTINSEYSSSCNESPLPFLAEFIISAFKTYEVRLRNSLGENFAYQYSKSVDQFVTWVPFCLRKN